MDGLGRRAYQVLFLVLLLLVLLRDVEMHAHAVAQVFCMLGQARAQHGVSYMMVR